MNMFDSAPHDGPIARRLARRLASQLALAAGAALVLVAVSAAYLEPGFVITVANQLWTCF